MDELTCSRIGTSDRPVLELFPHEYANLIAILERYLFLESNGTALDPARAEEHALNAWRSRQLLSLFNNCAAKGCCVDVTFIRSTASREVAFRVQHFFESVRIGSRCISGSECHVEPRRNVRRSQ